MQLPKMKALNLLRSRPVLYLFLVLGMYYCALRYLLAPADPNSDLRQSACYFQGGPSLPDVQLGPPPRPSSIFFHETSCAGRQGGHVAISARHACAVESAALLNPNLDVFLLYATPGALRLSDSESDDFLRSLLSYDNVKIRRLDLRDYARGTGIEHLLDPDAVAQSAYPYLYLSHVLKLLTLWKYGGVCVDLDVVVINTFEQMGLNFAGVESASRVGGVVLSADRALGGGEFLQRCFAELKRQHKLNNHKSSGTNLLTRVLAELCEEADVLRMAEKTCGGFRVFRSDAFNPIPWYQWPLFFGTTSNMSKVLGMFENTYVIHTWGTLNRHKKLPLELADKVPYTHFAQHYCPKVFSKCRTYF